MIKEILDLIEKKDFKQVKNILKDMLVPDIALVLEQIDSAADTFLVYRLLPKDLSAEVFSYIDSESQEHIVNYLSDKELAFIMEELATDDAVDFIEEMPANIVDRALKNATAETRKTVNKFLSYEEDTAGAVMTPEFIRLTTDMTVEKAIEQVRTFGEDAETINVLYVSDKTKLLKGVISIRDLILAKKEQKLEEIMEDNVIAVPTSMDQEKVGLMFKKYDVIAMPVVDNENRVVGIITVDDIMEVIEEETTKDIEQIAGVVSNGEKPYFKQGVWETFLRTIPWLLFLMVSATFTSLILNNYEEILGTIATGGLLIACSPMLMGTGGNAGGQSSVTIIRALALDEIKFKDTLKVFWKEVRVSIIVGFALAVVCFAKLLLVDNLIFGYDYTVVISFVISLSLFVTIVIAKSVGCLLPLFAKKIKLDPAVVAHPFISTFVDVLSLLIYCNIAIAILS